MRPLPHSTATSTGAPPRTPGPSQFYQRTELHLFRSDHSNRKPLGKTGGEEQNSSSPHSAPSTKHCATGKALQRHPERPRPPFRSAEEGTELFLVQGPLQWKPLWERRRLGSKNCIALSPPAPPWAGAAPGDAAGAQPRPQHPQSTQLGAVPCPVCGTTFSVSARKTKALKKRN